MSNCTQCGHLLIPTSSICQACGRQQKPRTAAGRKELPEPEKEAIELSIDDVGEFKPDPDLAAQTDAQLTDPPARGRGRGR